MSVSAEDETGQIDGHKPACASHLSAAKDGCGTGDRQNGVQPRRRLQPINQSQQQITPADTEGGAARSCLDQQSCDVPSRHGCRS